MSDVEFRTSRSSGPGGQHAQKSETRVEAVLDVTETAALTEAQRKRVPTKPSKAAKERRLDEKRRRGETKKLRRPPV